MATKEMTLHELLVAIKMTKKKLEAINILHSNGTAFIATTLRSSVETGSEDIEDAKTKLVSNLQKTIALISNLEEYEKVRAATNAVTKVRVGDTEMTISDAIKMKENIVFKKSLLNSLKDEIAGAKKEVSRNNTRLQERVDRAYAIVDGATPEVVEAMTKAKEADYAKNETVLLDPNNISDVIEKLTDEIDNFEGSIDSALSYINAVTKVTVTLAD